MTKRESLVSRKTVVEDRIAICPQYGCTHLERVKPLKFGVLGFRKYPKCSKHKISLVFVDEFIGDFFAAVKACLFDISSLPPLNLKYLIKTRVPDELMDFINGWMYCNPIGRGAQIVPRYIDGLSRAYIKLLSRKQRKTFINENSSRKRYEMLRLGLKKIADDYATFLQELHEKSEILYDPKKIRPLSDNVKKILKTWLKQHLNTIKGAINIKSNELDVQDDSLRLLKEKFDKILHAGTCALLLGKNPSIVIKSISAFELFSAYHEFLKASLCKELKGEDLNPILENFQEFLNINGENTLNIQNDEEIINLKNINITNFRQEVKYLLKTLFTSINGSQRQKNIIRSKSIEILDEFISRANSGEFYIPKDANLKVIASAIIYTVIISNKNTPKISVIQLAKVMNIKNWILITNYYRKYFDHLYPRKEFRFASYKGFLEIRNIISLYFFEILRNNEIEISDLVSNFLVNIQQKIKLPIKLKYKHNEILYEMATQYEDTFFKYFNDLGELIKHLIISSNIHKKIGAKLMITPVADFLNEKGFNQFQTRLSYISSVTDIFDFLRTKYPKIFPIRFRNFSKNRFTQEEYQKIVGNKLKIHAIRNIYNGFYLKYDCRCPQCVEEGFEINTSISRLSAIDVHHQGDLHENYYNAIALYNLFSKDRSNPYFLEDLILKMESEKVIVVCKNHHTGFSFKYLKYFQYLISWDNIFDYSPALINALIRIAVNNYIETKNLDLKIKKEIRRSIKRSLKKRYIIETIYGEKCHLCEEFTTKKHLDSFQAHHDENEIKTVNPKELFDLPCSKIVQILKQEGCGYVCANCHMVLQYEIPFYLLDKIYEENDIITEVIDDYNYAVQNFTPINNINSIKNPLLTIYQNNDTFERYLTAIYEIQNSREEVTTRSIANVLNLKETHSVRDFFKRHEKIINDYVSIEDGIIGKPNKYSLANKGLEAVKLMYHFRDYYKSL